MKTDVKPKRRASAPKTRNGCITCKARHVKCDERKPGCLRCEKFQVGCDGYLMPDSTVLVQRKTKAPLLLPKLSLISSANSTTSPTVKIIRQYPRRLAPQQLQISSPSPNPLFWTEAEHMYFKVFHDRAALELSGYFDTDFWGQTILQICHEEEFARHAVIALGALSETMEEVQSDKTSLQTSEEIRRAHHQLALRHYGKALKLMRELPDRKGQTWIKYALLSCLLTTCFENYMGNQESAIAAARAGVELLNQKSTGGWCESETELYSAIRQRSFDDIDLMSTFDRLEAVVILHNQSRHITNPRILVQLQERTPFKCNMPSQFATVREARMYCDFHVKRALAWQTFNSQRASLADLDWRVDEQGTAKLKIEEFSQRAEAEFEEYRGAREKWYQAFQPVFESSRKDPGSKDFLGASMLMIQYVSSNLMCVPPEEESELIFDQYTLQYHTLVELSRELLETFPRTKARKAVFSFDDGFVASLFSAATRCRDRDIRRQAIKLLVGHPRREGLWDSAAAAKVACWLVNLEEEEMLDGFVPESSRLRIEKMDTNLMERKVVVRCSKREDAFQGRYHLDDVVLSW
ncbi:hypothetical protein DL98DRAFT_59014 [Cadophora sp. DSE1049]|nr:hypothetical protein DL98DRAFT_59014 [Cadophora sp. DSE1049]